MFFGEAEEFDCSTFFESFLGFVSANTIYACTDTKYERVSVQLQEPNMHSYLS